MKKYSISNEGMRRLAKFSKDSNERFYSIGYDPPDMGGKELEDREVYEQAEDDLYSVAQAALMFIEQLVKERPMIEAKPVWGFGTVGALRLALSTALQNYDIGNSPYTG